MYVTCNRGPREAPGGLEAWGSWAPCEHLELLSPAALEKAELSRIFFVFHSSLTPYVSSRKPALRSSLLLLGSFANLTPSPREKAWLLQRWVGGARARTQPTAAQAAQVGGCLVPSRQGLL